MSTSKQWESFLTPEITHERLISSSIFITAFELLKESIIGRIKDFYSDGLPSDENVVSEEYKERVLSKNKSTLYAPLAWLTESEVIDEADLDTFEQLKGIRNKLAHELPSHVLGVSEFSISGHLEKALFLLRKIEVWWVVNFELAINPDYDDQEIDEEGIVPGPVLMMQIMLEVVSGNKSLLEHYLRSSGGQKSEP